MEAAPAPGTSRTEGLDFWQASCSHSAMARSRKLFTPLIFAAALAARAALPEAVFQTNWTAQPEQGGYYEAQANGTFVADGIRVRINQGGPGAFPLQEVALGRAQFGIGRSDDVMVAVERGLPLVIVCAQLEHDPQAIAVHADSPVRTFRDLDGRTIKAVLGQAWLDYLRMKYRIHFGVIPENYGFAQFAADPDLIQQSYLTSDAYYCAVHHVPVRMLPIFDSGYDAYRVVFTSRDFAARHPAAVRAFVRASIRGWKDFLYGDPRPGEALLARDNPENTPGLDAYDRKVLVDDHLAACFPSRGERLGLLTRRRLAGQIAILARLHVLTTPLTVDQVADLGFLPPDLKALAGR
jgi:NitT/TauT family transport system substrate-binding protein